MIQRSTPLAVFFTLTLGLSACGGTVTGSPAAAQGIAVRVQPLYPQVVPSGSVNFTSVVTGTANMAVLWQVVEASGGTITSTGGYTAPATTGQYHVKVSSVADPSAQAVATVTVTSTPPPSTADCATAPLRTTGTIHYYCDCGTGAASGCVAGNDANPGTSSVGPRRTLANALSTFNSMPGGDTVALCRGGAWNAGGGDLSNSNCTSNAVCEFRDYTPAGQTARPRLNVGGTGFSHGGSATAIRFWNMDVRGNAADYSTMLWEVGSRFTLLDICNSAFDGGRSAINMEPISGATSTNVTFRYNQCSNQTFSSIAGGNPGLVVDSNLFTNNGLNGTPQDHTMYIWADETTNGGPTNMHIVNNEIVTDTRCNGVMLVVHGILETGLVIQNNYIHTTSTSGNCYGMSMSGSAASGAYPNATVTRNRVITGGTTAIEVACSPGAVVTDNVVVNGTLNVGTDTTNAGCTSGYTTTRATVRNNTLYAPTNSAGINLDGSTGSTGNVYENNASLIQGGGCGGVSVPTIRNGNNYCAGSGVAPNTVWVSPTTDGTANFKPANPGPLIGTANQTYYSPVAIGTVTWSATDTGQPRVAPIDIGAFQR